MQQLPPLRMTGRPLYLNRWSEVAPYGVLSISSERPKKKSIIRTGSVLTIFTLHVLPEFSEPYCILATLKKGMPERFFKGLVGIGSCISQNVRPAHPDRPQIYLAWRLFAASTGRIASKSLLSAIALHADASLSPNCQFQHICGYRITFQKGTQLFHFGGKTVGVLIKSHTTIGRFCGFESNFVYKLPASMRVQDVRNGLLIRSASGKSGSAQTFYPASDQAAQTLT